MTKLVFPPRPPSRNTANKALRRWQVYCRKLRRNGEVRCFICFEPLAWNECTLEHIVPLSKGGRQGKYNLDVSHKLCNLLRGNKDLTHDE